MRAGVAEPGRRVHPRRRRQDLYVWKGDACSPFEGSAAAIAAEALESSRDGRSTATHEVDAAFWGALGGEGEITSAEDAPALLPDPVAVGEGVLFRLSDASGELAVAEVGRGDLKRAMLASDDVFLCDTGAAVLVWIGGGASARESAAAMDTATKYLAQAGKPLTTSVTVIKEGFGRKDPIFREVFAN